ncbi:hypothetical protein L6452_03874 [Arctium lappa]|uniref:Uncharacterized protein n=1 Tax=Arctium lappa TaxID=4217 RepID=A0ACB9FND1_ARCLA|nr:hypothetical protein L6452_03874 [Arctium lappa]
MFLTARNNIWWPLLWLYKYWPTFGIYLYILWYFSALYLVITLNRHYDDQNVRRDAFSLPPARLNSAYYVHFRGIGFSPMFALLKPTLSLPLRPLPLARMLHSKA